MGTIKAQCIHGNRMAKPQIGSLCTLRTMLEYWSHSRRSPGSQCELQVCRHTDCWQMMLSRTTAVACPFLDERVGGHAELPTSTAGTQTQLMLCVHCIVEMTGK